ncbi:MAG: hypothetical protein H0U87_06305 [Acidobacteria bacterium]|nr:hypothetical protein [Acidobacteriota bacterium]
MFFPFAARFARSYFKLFSAVFIASIFLSIDASAQKKKLLAAIAETSKKTQTAKQQTTPSKKTTAKTQSADKKTTAKQTAQEKQTASKKEQTAKSKSASDAKTRQMADAKTRAADAKKQAANERRQTEENRLADLRRQAEEARRNEIEAARRQAALEERRRREQAAREARERALAFERGLHTETVQNIANDDTDGEDLEVRRAAINALGNKAGMVVVMEPQTGRILSIVNQDWAIRKSYKPCSTIKLVTAIGGLNENVIDQTNGNITSRSFPMNLNDALAFSNNRYFQVVGANFGNRKMLAYAQMFGLGKPTGINSDNESGGRLPFGNNGAKVYSHGEDFEVSPLQLAVLVSAISNGGKIVVPQTPRTKFEKANFKLTTRGTVNLPAHDLLGVVPGMIGAATYGTARRGVDASLGIAGKTGSCIGQGSWLGLFTSVAPIANPKLAVVVITRGQAERGKYAAAVAGKIYRALSSRLREKTNPNFTAQTPPAPQQIVKPKPKVDAKTAALIDNENAESAPDAAAEDETIDADNDAFLSKGKKGGAGNNPAAPTTSAPLVRKAENKTNKPAENLFSPIIITVKKEKTETTRPRIVSHE